MLSFPPPSLDEKNLEEDSTIFFNKIEEYNGKKGAGGGGERNEGLKDRWIIEGTKGYSVKESADFN